MKPFQLFYVTAMVALGGSHVLAIPLDSPAVDVVTATKENVTEAATIPDDSKQPTTPASNSEDLETSNSNPEATYVLPEHHASGGPTHFDPSIYAGYLSPEAFQQYLAQFAGAFAPYAYPGYGPAPAPVYPGPFAVQTGYDGFLVPSISASVAASGTTSTATSIASNILTALQNLIPSLMSSTIVQVILTALAALAMVLFGGAMTTAICNFTPLCDISFKAVTYLRGNGAGDVGRMLVEEMTPERVRRAAEIVRQAIRKYKQMQKMINTETEDAYEMQ